MVERHVKRSTSGMACRPSLLQYLLLALRASSLSDYGASWVDKKRQSIEAIHYGVATARSSAGRLLAPAEVILSLPLAETPGPRPSSLRHLTSLLRTKIGTA